MTLKFSCFVTGTDTGVGKTLVSTACLQALAHKGLKATGMKPVAAGTELIDGEWVNDDVEQLVAASSLALPRELTAPYVLREACAPHIAAALEQVSIDPSRLMQACQQISAYAEAVVVEGVGGFRVPLSQHFDTADLAAGLQLDVILVVGLRLGCLNHALLTAEAIAARGLKLAGWVANTIEPDMPHQQDNLRMLEQQLPAPLLGVLPRMTLPPAEMTALAAQSLRFDLLDTWPEPAL